jgi:hypothetical protein
LFIKNLFQREKIAILKKNFKFKKTKKKTIQTFSVGFLGGFIWVFWVGFLLLTLQGRGRGES